MVPSPLNLAFGPATTSHWYCDSEGNSPLKLQWERGKGCLTGDDNLPSSQPTEVPLEGQDVRIFLNSGNANPPLDVAETGLAFQQSFEIWATTYYWATAPEGYTAIR